MKKYFRSLIKLFTISILLSLNSCTDVTEEIFSDMTEDGYTYKAGDATRVLGAGYTNFRGMYGLHNYFTFQICTDETVMPANDSGWDDGGVYRRMHLHTWNSEQPQIYTWWQLHYRGVYLTNRAISLLESGKIPMASNENKSQMIAEARTLRAYHYWQIMDSFGDAPLVTTYSDDLFLPEKASRKAIYDYLISELTDIINNKRLSEDKNNSTYGRFNIWGAKALLANIYLNAEVYTGTAEWTKCKKECDDILASGKYQLDSDYRMPFKAKNESSSENIMVIPFDNKMATGFNYYKIALHASNQKTFNALESPWGAGSYTGIPQFIDTYDQDDDRFGATWLHGAQYESDGTTPLVGLYDMRDKPLVFVNKMPNGRFVSEAEGYRWLKYEIVQGVRPSLDNDYVIFRLAQVYMMKAECMLRTGDANGAAGIVTFVRQRAFKGTPDKASVTGEQLQQPSSYVYGTVENYVLTPQTEKFPKQFGRFYDELGWEFAGESMRRRDMIRFGHYTKAEWLSHKPNGDYRTVFPLPETVLSTNNKLTQNPAYSGN